MKKKSPNVVLRSVLTVVTAALLIAALIGTNIAMGYEKVINIYFGTSNYRMEKGDGNTVQFSSDYASEDDLVSAENLLCQQIEEEGAVLLKNDGVLPLAQGGSVSLFSHSSVDLVYGGTGSAATDTSTAPTLKDALEQVGFAVNPTLWDFYSTGEGSKYLRSVPSWTNTDAVYAANEVPWSAYTEDVKSSVAQYGDSAIVVLSRVGGEDNDLLVTDPETYESLNYLELSAEEQDLLKNLKAMKDAGTIKNIVVLLNTANALEVDFLFDDTYGVDAALWIGDVGQTGINGVAEILAGNVNPSGRLVDTYCIDNTTSPVMANFGDKYFSNADEKNLYMSEDFSKAYACIVYQEGIYVGYRYYETRYEDTVMNTGNTQGYDYHQDVAYPFGYGLSYTNFEWSDYSMKELDDAFEVTVTVKNTGAVAGKDVVEVYMQSPYTDYDKANGIEKSSVQLCGFEKTGVIEPGASETVTVTVDKSNLRTYDANGEKTYIVDAGTYYFTAGANAHDAVNNILAAKGYTADNGMDAAGNANLVSTYENEKMDTTTYAVSTTGAAITNQFDDVDINKNELIEDSIVYLTRSDWNGTFPTEQASVAMTDAMLAVSDEYLTYEVPDSDGEMPVMGQNNGLSLANYIGVSYDDESWNDLLDQLTFDEMRYLSGVAYHATNAVASVSKPETKDENGPQGLTALLTHGASAMAYTSEDVMAATWNKELVEKIGKSIGEDCLNAGYSGLYGPAMNTHRSPYSGRNFEYYSEDAFISGTMAAAEIRGIQSKGVYVYAKHFALNDQETNRFGAHTFANEQTIREIYLVPFEKAVVEGDAWCVMTGLNFIGLKWTSTHTGLIENVLRGEWGMRGIVLTDYAEGMPYEDVRMGLLSGTNAWDCSGDEWAVMLQKYSNNPLIANALRESAHRILYTVVNSNAMNGMSSDAHLVRVMPWWKTAIYALDVVLAAAFVVSLIATVRGFKAKKSAAKN